MQDTLDTVNVGRDDDLSALAWVHVELRRSLETAHKALRRYLRESEAASGSDVDAVDPAVLRTARSHLHQGVGALELVGLPVVADVLRASEAAVQRLVARPALVNLAAVATVEHLSFALLDFLGRQLAGKPVSPVMLFPQYRDAQQLARADRIHPADLWRIDWQWLELPPDASAQPRHAGDEARSAMEALVLTLMREPSRSALAHMSDLCADLGAGARDGSRTGAGLGGGSTHLATFWQLAAAMFEAQAVGLLASDVHTKRIASRLLAQLRMSMRGQHEISDRLAQDLLFFCSHAKPPQAGHPAPRLAAVRLAWRLDERPTADYEAASLGRFDPATVSQARKRVAAAKDAWSAVAGEELHRLSGLGEQFALVGDSLQRLLPSGEVLAQALEAAVAQTVAAATAPPAALAMEVATGMLYVDATIEDGELDHPDLAARVQHLARRIDSVRSGGEPQPLEIWMEELYRRVSDRQTMGSVVQELRASLSEVEKQIDQYFRNPARREVLIPVPAQLSAMRGVFSVMGLSQASQAVVHMRDAVDELAQTEVDPQRAIQTGTFDRLADNLGALSFLIDMISVQPALAKSLFRFDAEAGSLSAVMGQPERVSAFAELEAAPATGEPLPLPAVTGSTGMEDNADVREIFIEEAREVIAHAREALERLADTPESNGDMTTVRRVFHTLKGSARMVGLPEFGETAWACEQLFNARLAHAPLMDQPLRLFTGEVLDYLGAWVEAIAAGRDGGHRAAAVAAAADSLRLDGLRVTLESPLPAPAPEAPALGAAAALPPAPGPAVAAGPAPVSVPSEPEAVADFELAPMPPEPAHTWDTTITLPPPTPPAPTPAPAPLGLDFEFDLGDETAVEPVPSALESLTLRVPDLPSAADLDFGLLDLGEQAATEPVAALAPTAADAVDFDLDLDLTATPALPAAPVPADAALDLPPLGLLDLPLEALQPESGAGDLPAPEVRTLEMDAGLADLMFPPLTESTPSMPEPAPVPDLGMAALEAVTEPKDASTEVPSGSDFRPAEPAHVELPEAAAEDTASEDEQVKIIGPLRIGIPLFNIYLNEADELSRRLGIQLAEWALEHDRHPVPETSVALAHSMAGSSATVGYGELSALARALEHALMRSHAAGHGRAGEPELFNEAAEEIRRLLHQFAAGFLRPVAPELMERLALHERLAPESVPAAGTESAFDLLAEPGGTIPATRGDEDIDAVDTMDDELFPIFEEEAEELLPQLQTRLREWLEQPHALDAASACLRTLHTFKGGARLAGAMRLGEMAHRLETAIEGLAARGSVSAADVEPLLGRADAMASAFDALRVTAAEPLAEAATEPNAEPAAAAAAEVAPAPGPVPEPAVAAAESTATGAPAAVDWQRFVAAEAAAEGLAETAADRPAGGAVVVRVRAALLDRLVNQAGEVSITRARMDADVRQLQTWLSELSDSLDRMRRQLRDIELQAETQIGSRLEAAKVASVAFDPLEMDRFTRFQELTRFMAESVNDVATLQRSLQRTVQSTEDELAAQARLTRELQDDLLRTRMVEFESMADRLYRTVRQAAKDAGRQVRLDIEGGAIEIDRGVLERMTGPFEHLLRNAVAHGIEAPAQREQAGKEAGGRITIAVAQAGNEVAVEISDDGAGLDLQRIRQRAVERGLVAPEQAASDAELAQLIFSPGFSTVDSVTELAGRGVGLDVVRADVNAMGGRIETASTPGQGTRFKLLLPLTTAVTQVVMLRCGELQVAVPSTLIEVVRRVPAAEVERAYAEGSIDHEGQALPFFWLAALLHTGTRGAADDRAQAMVIIRSAAQRVAVHVDEVVGNQEVVVKNIGPQLARLPGLVGVTLLPSGLVALIYNPVALASVYAESARALMRSGAAVPGAQTLVAAPVRTPMVMVVDDSLTVRRVTQRLLVREGWRVVLAKDGLEALERLAEERPVVLLTDIEMPRMDGFDLVRNVRANPRLADLPVVMITSRIAQKHRDYAAELGVQHYLGKPYSEEELLSLVAQYAGAAAPDILT